MAAESAAQSSPSGGPQTDSWIQTEFTVIKFTHRWTLPRFDMILRTAGDGDKHAMSSPPFSSGRSGDNLQWCIKVIPKAASVNYSSRFDCTDVNISLVVGSDSEIMTTALFRCFILDGSQNKKRQWSQSNDTFFYQYKLKQSKRLCYIRTSVLTDSSNGLLPEGNLTLYFEIAVLVQSTNTTSGEELTSSELGEPDNSQLRLDFRSLLDSGLFSDATIIARGKEFKAHKNILYASSPIFRAMFDHKMRESVQNRVAIDDLSPEVVQEMLTFIYTGQSPNLKKMPGDLLRAADKYDLKQLKGLSERELADRVSPENLVDTLLLADQHSATELRKVCMKLFTIHAEEVVKTEGWSKLLQSGHHLITEFVVVQAKTCDTLIGT